jgi:imidazole glycerol-phosphate synthase subunit HisH
VIVIIDYGMGNTASILNMIRRMGGDATISSDRILISEATALILPGVGSFDNAIDKLHASNLVSIIKQRVLDDKIPFLGICLGMHLLFDSSEEGSLLGLGLIPGIVKRFDFEQLNDKTLKIPHMGWNIVYPKTDNSLFSGLESELRFYFVHSYHVVCDNPIHEIATSVYGYRFTCGVQKDNIYAVQFHPEKSHKFGMQMFKNFLGLVC